MATTRKTPSKPLRRASAKLKKSRKRAPTASPAGLMSGTAAATPATPATSAAAEAANRFVRDLQVRGEAARLTSDGKLALSATHAITEEREGLVQKVKRARFKAF
ncbi:MAG TPA: hypothetical protein VMW75_04005 [Thermoanaerobaculia bacterium]|nr:hypothetical protein [Thermoanaerobaculia bacterium]